MVVVSVIIPTYGDPLFLSQCIESVINQTCKDWELIIVDDNSPDTMARHDTEAIVNKYLAVDRRIRYIKHERNMNGAVARNTGFAFAKGNYISLLDSDDEYLPNRLQSCIKAMENAAQDIAGVYTGCEFRRKGRVYYRYKDVQSGIFLKETLACTFNFCTGSNLFIRKSIVDELHGFDPTFFRHQDYEFLVRVFQKYSLIGIQDILVIKNNENLNLPDMDKQIAIKKQYLNKYKYILEAFTDKERDFVYLWNILSIAEGFMAQGKYKEANTYYRKARLYGHLPAKIRMKRLLYPLYNLCK